MAGYRAGLHRLRKVQKRFRLHSFLRWCLKLGYPDSDSPGVDSLFLDSDGQLFDRINHTYYNNIYQTTLIWSTVPAADITTRHLQARLMNWMTDIFSRPYLVRSRYWYAVASVVVFLSSVTLCIVAKRCVLEQKLLLRAYRKSYIRNRLVPKWMTLTFV